MIFPTREDRIAFIAELACLVGDDGTGDLGVIVDSAEPDATVQDLAEVVLAAREEAAAEKKLCSSMFDEFVKQERALTRIAQEDVYCPTCQLLGCDHGSLCGLEQPIADTTLPQVARGGGGR